MAVFFGDSRLRMVRVGGGGQKRKAFSAHAKPTDKEKLFSTHNDTDFALQQN